VRIETCGQPDAGWLAATGSYKQAIEGTDSLCTCVQYTRQPHLVLTILQKKAIRIINKSQIIAHTQPLFFQNKILPFDKLVTKSRLIFIHAIQYGYAHETFLNSWATNIARNSNLQLRNAPNPRVDSFKNIPLCSFGNE
jgi:hypothetical protein